MSAPHPDATGADERTRRLLERLARCEERFGAIERDLGDPEVAGDHHRVRELSVVRAALEPVVAAWRRWQALREEIAECERALGDAGDPDLAELARAELPRLRDEADALLASVQRDLVTSADRRIGRLFLEVRAGVGGDEAALWAGDLVEIYRRFAAQRGWRVEVADAVPGDAGGVKAAVLEVEGDGAWSALGYEGGTHQVKRVPATESQGRVHTSTATVAVLPEPDDETATVDRSDVQERITTAQGPGGQNVNKVATAVHLIHKPTGIEVRIQDTKSQARNREVAWQLLRARVAEQQRREREAARAEARAAMIGRGDRAEKIRTYRWKENVAVDHRVGVSAPLEAVLAGGLDPLVEALVERDVTERLAADLED